METGASYIYWLSEQYKSAFSGPSVFVKVVNTTNELKKDFELFRACDNVCSKNFDGNKLVVDGVEVSGTKDVGYKQVLWHLLLHGMDVKGTYITLNNDVPDGCDYVFRIKHTSVENNISLRPIVINRQDIALQHQKNIIRDVSEYHLGYSDAILLDIPAKEEVCIHFYKK